MSSVLSINLITVVFNKSGAKCFCLSGFGFCHFCDPSVTLCLDGWILGRMEKFGDKIGEKMRKGVVW